MPNGEPGDADNREDEIDRRLRELTGEVSVGSRVHEPTAAERARAAAKRGKRPPRPQRRRRGGRITAWVIAIAILAVSATFSWYHFHPSPNALDDTNPVRNGAVPPSSSPSTVSPSPYVAAGPPLTRSPGRPRITGPTA